MSAWWSRQLEELIETPGLQRELRRGRRYVEEGRVSSLDVSAGRVSALIQGTRPAPYRVHLDIAVLSDEDWDHALQELFAHAGAWLALKGGQMPTMARRWHLVPREPIEIMLRCSCPVRDLFCKHTAAAVYALAAETAQAPVLLFQWRGRGPHAIDALWAQRARRRGSVA
jgi:uncharacterized Zn finger protein